MTETAAANASDDHTTTLSNEQNHTGDMEATRSNTLDLMFNCSSFDQDSLDAELDQTVLSYLEDSSKIESDSELDGEVDINSCIECRAHRSQVFCEQCHDYFCQLCFSGQHRKGNRKRHTTQPCLPSNTVTESDSMAITEEDRDISISGTSSEHEDSEADSAVSDCSSRKSRTICHRMGSLLSIGRVSTSTLLLTSGKQNSEHVGQSVLERSKFIPMRLTYDERKQLRLLEAALCVCRYTDNLDTMQAMENPNKRVRMQLQEICGFLSGIVTASNYCAGQKLLQDKQFEEKESFLQKIFELGRRYKIMNPEKMRGEYGKLMYLLQDAANPKIEELLGISLQSKIKTVFDVLNERNALELLSDARIELATMVVSPEGKKRTQIQKEIRLKQHAIGELTRRYGHKLEEDLIEQCLYSIADNNYHLYFERDPIDRMIQLLREHFDPQMDQDHDKDAASYSLAIERGQDGARLSHTHTRQFHYVLQSLTLWREISHDMFRLWYLTDQDLLSPKNQRYKLADTGQGVQRVQPAPLVSRAMHVILHTTQCRLGLDTWVGSSVIHLGDKNVPNALLFIDKYTQIGHILRPIVKTVDQLPELASQSNDLKTFMIKTFGGIAALQKCILADFFREAFDGSGGDNFFDAGSCIDGRLTSAWNWCSNLPRKPFFPVFKIAGFVGFDGKFA